MPKVSESYKLKKKAAIVDAAAKVLRSKTLYELNMTDVIKEAGLSKGGIYLYYKDIDEIIVDVMDREMKANDLSEKLERFRNEEKKENSFEANIYTLFRLYASYLQESSILAGKLQFELTILVTQNMERAMQIREKVSIRKIGVSFLNELDGVIREYLRESPYMEQKSREIAEYIQCFLDGSLEIYVLMSCYQFSDAYINLDKTMDMLAENVIRMMREVIEK